jgi:hypothetical protein
MTDDEPNDIPETALGILKALLQMTPVTAVLAGFADTIQDRRARKQLRYFQAVIANHDKAIEELRAALSSEPLLELIDSAMRIAAESHSDDKILLLANVTAEAIRPETAPEKIDTGQYLIDVLAALEPPDIQVLRVIAARRQGTGQLAGLSVTGGLDPGELAARLPALNETLGVALARLTASGLILNQGPGSSGAIGPTELHSATEAGRWVVDALDQLKSK